MKSAKAAEKAPAPSEDAITPVPAEATASASAVLQTTTGLTPAPKQGRSSQVSRGLRTALNKLRNASTVQAPFGTLVRTRDQPATPDVRGPAPDEKTALPAPVRAMNASRLARLDARMNKLAHKLVGQGALAPPGLMPAIMPAARESDQACADTIDAMFPVQAGDSLGQLVMADLAPAMASPARTREAALLVTLALREATGVNRGRAAAAWQHIAAATPAPTVAGQRDVNAVLRALAGSDFAFGALWTLLEQRGHATDPAQREPFKFALQAVDALVQGGVNPGPASSFDINDFVQHARQRYVRAPKQIGTTEDADALACATLLYATSKLAPGKRPVSRAQTAAYVAWRNGFRESGPGTEFNEAIHRVHKFVVWIARATKTPATLGGKVTDFVKHSAQGIAGLYKSPLASMEYGTLGAELGELHTEKASFQEALGSALDVLQQALLDELAKPAEEDGSSRERSVATARLAMVEYWQALAPDLRKGFKLDPVARKLVRARVGDSNEFVPRAVIGHASGQTLSLSTLERWAADVMAPDSQTSKDFHKQVDKARGHASGTWSKPPSNPSVADLLDVAKLALKTEGVEFRHDRVVGLTTGINFGFSTPVASVGAGVGPQVRLARGKQASVWIGTTTVGSEVSMSTVTRSQKSGVLAGTVGMEMKKLDSGVLSFGGLVGVRHARDSEHGKGVTIRVSKNVKEHKEIATEVLEYLFAQGARRSSGKRMREAQLWENFAMRFRDVPEVAVDFFSTSAKQNRTHGGIAAGLRLGFNPLSFGPFFSVGGEHSRSRSERKEIGHTATQGTAFGTGNTVSGLLTVSGAVVNEVKLHNSKPLSSVRVPHAFSFASWLMSFNLRSETTRVRVTVEDGKVQPKMSLAQRQFRTEKDYLRYIESQRDAWEGAVKGGKAQLDKGMREVRELPAEHTAGNRIYQERRRLTDAVGWDLSFLLGARQLLDRQGAGADIAATEAAMRAKLCGAANWVPEKLAVSEVASWVSEAGVDLVAVLRSRRSATSTNRYLHQIKPG